MSLNNLGTMLSDLGRREPALQAAQEATDLYRRLTEQRPDAFLPDLAMSLSNLGLRLSDLGRREPALAATEEAVRVLAPFFLRLPAAFAPWMTTMIRNYRQRCTELEVEPDAELLEPLQEALEKLG